MEDNQAPCGRRFILKAVPFSKNITFGVAGNKINFVYCSNSLLACYGNSGLLSIAFFGGRIMFYVFCSFKLAPGNYRTLLDWDLSYSWYIVRGFDHRLFCTDIKELISILSDSHGECSMIGSYRSDTADSICPPKVRTMLASRACRSSVMIGDSLGRNEMIKVLNLGGVCKLTKWGRITFIKSYPQLLKKSLETHPYWNAFILVLL